MKNANRRNQNKNSAGTKFSKKENFPNGAKTLHKKKVTHIKKHRTSKTKSSSEIRKIKARTVAKRRTKSRDKAAPKRYPTSHDKKQVKNMQKKGHNLRGEEEAYQQLTFKAATDGKPPKSDEKRNKREVKQKRDNKREVKQKRGQKILTEEQAYQKQVHLF